MPPKRVPITPEAHATLTAVRIKKLDQRDRFLRSIERIDVELRALTEVLGIEPQP